MTAVVDKIDFTKFCAQVFRRKMLIEFVNGKSRFIRLEMAANSYT